METLWRVVMKTALFINLTWTFGTHACQEARSVKALSGHAQMSARVAACRLDGWRKAASVLTPRGTDPVAAI